MTRSLHAVLALLPVAGVALPAPPPPRGPPRPRAPRARPAPTPPQDDDPDRDPNNAQPDFYVATMPTNLRLPKGKMACRLTHRFLRTLGDGDFGDLVKRAFGFDSGAQIGLELKYGLFRGGQVGVYRTSDRTIPFSGQYEAVSPQNR